MNVEKKYLFIIFRLLFALVGLVGYILLCNMLTNNNFKIDKITKTKENFVNRKMFGVYLKDENGEYVEYTESDSFPNSTIYKFNLEKSYCVDNNDNLLSNVLNYNDENVIVTSNKAFHCYLYFDMDNTPPSILAFYLGGSDNPVYAVTTNINVYLNWNDDDVAYYCITNTQESNNCDWQNVSKNSITSNYTLTSGDETKIVYAFIKDKAGNISSVSSDTIILDTEPPTSNSVIINSNAQNTSSTSVTLTLSSSGATKMCISNTESCSSWETYATNKNWTLSSGDGEKTVYVWYKDDAGNIVPNYVTDKITYMSEPTNNSVKINSNASYTNTTSVTLTLSSTGATQMCISNTTSCSSWETYATSKSWTLNNTTNGTKTVYVWYKNALGTVTSNYVTDTIVLDTVAPTNNSVSINNGATYTNSTSVTLSLSSSGASQVCISNTTSCSSWQTYYSSKSWTLNNTTNGTKTVYVWYKDAAGNATSSYVKDTITLETTIPTVTASLSGTSTSPTITFSSNEAGTYCINRNSSTTNMSSCVASGSLSANTSKTTSTLSVGTYYVHVQDAAGNIGVSSAVDIANYVCTTKTAFGTCLKSAKTAGYNTNIQGGLYRYQGTSSAVNNYVCFGTTSKSTCTSNPYTYMYRVIGINSSNQVKLVKAYSLERMQWYTDHTTNITWPNSIIYKNINGSSFLTNTTYVPSGWSSKIATYSWKYGEYDIRDNTASYITSYVEGYWTNSISAKIGLIYFSDYYYAYQSGGLNCYDNASTCRNSWIYSYESAVIGRSYSYNTYFICNVSDDGSASCSAGSPTAKTLNILPAFFLTTSVKYISGRGTSSDPFIIS